MNKTILLLLLAITALAATAQPYNQNPTQSVCVGTQPYFIDPATVPGATYHWSVSGGGTIISGSGTNSVTIDWTTAGGPYTVSVYLSSNGCDGQTQSVQVTVVASPSATITYGSGSFCTSSQPVIVTHTGTSGGTYSASPSGLTINATNGTITPATSTPGNYTITYTIAPAGGCPLYTTSTTVTINQAPNTSPIWHN
ncbi:MAG: hypothetical protein ACM3ME_00775 [Chloroflexota bacterium]|nr:hypothetical protein [Lentimicrobium sp.]